MIIRENEAELICDFAEYYHLLNYRGLPLNLVVTLLFGLRDESRIKMKLSGATVSFNQMLFASIADSLNFIAWTKTKDAEANRNRPSSIIKSILKKDDEKKNEVFASAEAFEKARAELLKGE